MVNSVSHKFYKSSYVLDRERREKESRACVRVCVFKQINIYRYIYIYEEMGISRIYEKMNEGGYKVGGAAAALTSDDVLLLAVPPPEALLPSLLDLRRRGLCGAGADGEMPLEERPSEALET